MLCESLVASPRRRQITCRQALDAEQAGWYSFIRQSCVKTAEQIDCFRSNSNDYAAVTGTVLV